MKWIGTKKASVNLHELALFTDLTPEQLSKLDSLLHRKAFPAGAIVITVEQPGEMIYIIVNGTVKVHLEQSDGKDVILSILGAGEIFGEMSLLDNIGRSANVITLEETEMLWMDKLSFQQCLLTMPVLLFNLARILSKRLRLANEQIQALAAMETENRVARQLLAFGQRYGKAMSNGDTVIPIRLIQSDIASLVGASDKRVNQIIVSYKERKYISVDHKHHITIHNQKALANRCQ
jgi:CRP/FNR family cyclic AMP-dependent transcriptional regulator